MLATLQPFSDCCAAIIDQAAHIRKSHPGVRQELLAGIHNPWGYDAVGADPWAFLDVCEHREVLSLVSKALGSDLILWDSELYISPERYEDFVAAGKEGRYWPFEPEFGAVVVAPLSRAVGPQCFLYDDLKEPFAARFEHSLFVIRYMSTRARFERDARYRANWAAMEEQLLNNLSMRPLWLVSGTDHSRNDFVTGFSTPAPSWAAVALQES